MDEPDKKLRHSWFDDIQAFAGAMVLIGLSITFFQKGGVLTGGITGLSLIVHYASGWPFGLILFILNLPFYFFGWHAMGWVFTVRSFLAVAVLSGVMGMIPHWIDIAELNPVFAAIGGGLLAGTGLLMLVRHRGSLGGIGVLALYLQQKFGWRAGWVQLGLDVIILSCGLFVASWWQFVLSVIGAVVLNSVLAINHRPERYVGT